MIAQSSSQCLGNIRVLHEDNHLLVVDKPAGLLSQSAKKGDDNLLDRCKEYIKQKYQKPGNVYLGLVHRLDRNVSGVLVLARTSKAAARLTNAFKKRDLEKYYLGLCLGSPRASGQLQHRIGPNPNGRGVIESDGGKDAKLTYRRLGSSRELSLLHIRLETGRKHQIRAQLALAHIPLLGDPLYGTPTKELRRPALLACSLAFAHPVGSASLQFEARIPADLSKVLVEHNLYDKARDAIAGHCS